jgi:hypothetical protein
MSRSKDIGTRGETAVIRYARDHGFPAADRRPLKGSLDEGDILLCHQAILEVKSGKTAQNASYNQKLAWLAETERERVNAATLLGALVVQRRGFGVGRVESWEFWWTERMPFEAPACVALEHGLRRIAWALANLATHQQGASA